MSLSHNIKRLRLDKELTQEQLAAALGVSPQAVSKWETSETYPDGSLLVPLARELGVSLDELFDNDAVSMADISQRIIALLHNTEKKERFNVARELGWQIERGLFNCRMQIEKKYDPEELKNQRNSSYILDDSGFTLVSNGEEPFFAVFPQPEGGFGHFLNGREELQKTFAALSHSDTMDALIYLYRKESCVFEGAALARECGIADGQIETVLNELMQLRIVWRQVLSINSEKRTLYHSQPDHVILALFLIAGQLSYEGPYSLHSQSRNTPLLEG